jgi:hypothetical protein
LLGEDRGVHFIGGWDADDFFVTLAQKLQSFPPRFVTQPFSHLKATFSMLTDDSAPRNDSDEAPDFRQSRFDVSSVVRPQLENLIRSREQSLSGEYFFLSANMVVPSHRLEKGLSRHFRQAMPIPTDGPF